VTPHAQTDTTQRPRRESWAKEEIATNDFLAEQQSGTKLVPGLGRREK
jgi:hypothetical protein